MCGSPPHPPRFVGTRLPFDWRRGSQRTRRIERGRIGVDRTVQDSVGRDRNGNRCRRGSRRIGGERTGTVRRVGRDPRRGMASRDRSGSLGGYPSRRGGCKIPTERDRSTGSILVGSCTPRAHPFLLRRFLSGYIPSRNEQGGPSDLPTRIDSPRFHPSGCIGRI